MICIVLFHEKKTQNGKLTSFSLRAGACLVALGIRIVLSFCRTWRPLLLTSFLPTFYFGHRAWLHNLYLLSTSLLMTTACNHLLVSRIRFSVLRLGLLLLSPGLVVSDL